MQTGHEKHVVLLLAEPVLFYATLQEEMTVLETGKRPNETYALDFLGGGTLALPEGNLKEASVEVEG